MGWSRGDISVAFPQFEIGVCSVDINYISLHSLRHANATLLLKQGFDLKLVSEHLGHSTVAITGDTYADVLEETKRKMSESIALKLA